MGLKTTIGDQGVVTENLGDGVASQLVMTINQSGTSKRPVPVQVSNFTASQEYTLVAPPTAAGITASLPAIADSNIGTRFTFLKSAGTNPVLVSGSNNVNANTSGKVMNTANSSLEIIAVLSGSTYYWHAISHATASV